MRRARRDGRLAAAMLCLVAMASGCTGDSAHGEKAPRVEIAGGGTTGVYYGYGQRLAEQLSGHLGVQAEVAETGGSVENLRRVAVGESLFGFTAADAAADAVAGLPPFGEALPIRAVAQLYDDIVHVVVPAGSDIRELAELRGRRVSLGAVGSGTEVIAHRLLDAAGLERPDLVAVSLGIDGSIEAMRQGEIDAFFWSGGLPTPGVTQLADIMPIRLLALSEQVDAVNRAHSGVYRHTVVPAGAYGLTGAVAAMAVPNYLVTRADADPDFVADAARVLFDERVAISRDVPAAALLDSRRAIFTGPVGLHEGALRHYRADKP